MRRSLLLFLLLWPLLPSAARADGRVYRASGCGDHVFVQTQDGYSVLLTDGSGGIKDGDTLTGNLDRIGHPLLFDATTGHSVFGSVTERHLTKGEIDQRAAVRCRAPLGETVVSGYVTRAAGCGSRIFVNTAQGYAVLQRIAGGIVADGDTLVGHFNRPGQTTVEDRQSGARLVVFVEDLWLAKSAAERKMAASCRRR